jgi:predicted O-methyltransferase YrrM
VLKNRLALAEHFATLGFTIGAEIGVFDGYFSEHLCKTIPNLKLYSVDAWQVYAGYRDHRFENSMRNAEGRARNRLAKYDVEIIKEFSMDAVKHFADESLDFVYIDGNHEYKFVKEDIEAWAQKVRPGGIVAGDDYYMTRKANMGVIKAANEYAAAHGYDLETTLWDLDNEVVDNQQPAWWFIK